MKTGIELISEERQRQIEKEGWTHEHDDGPGHENGEMAHAAACYAVGEDLPIYRGTLGGGAGFDDVPCIRYLWPWERQWWKPTPNDRIRELTKAGALITAEIDRLQRLAVK